MNKREIINFIKSELENGDIRNNLFPMMTKFGVRDYSETVHTLGLNYITALGRYIEGVSTISECPVYPHKEDKYVNRIADEEAVYGSKTTHVRPDSVNTPILICEFERYEKNKRKDIKLIEKIQNLLISYHQLGGNVPIILFVYWSYANENPGDIDEYISIFDKGFKTDKGSYIQGIDALKTTYIVYRCVASGDEANLKLNQWVEVR
ncbi:MAG: hypothetical protein ACRCW0_09090 [Clostridium sp.]